MQDPKAVESLPKNERNESHLRAQAERKSLTADGDATDYGSLYSEPQPGVQAIEAISTSWTKWSLIIAYISCVPSKEKQVRLLNYATAC